MELKNFGFALFIVVLLLFIFLGAFTEWLWDTKTANTLEYAAWQDMTRKNNEMLRMSLSWYNNFYSPSKEYRNPIHPEDYDRLTSAYGHRVLFNPFTGGSTDSEHKGLDLVGTWHARVVTVADGVVRDNYYPPGNGWKGHPVLGGMIRIQHQSLIPYIFYTGSSVTNIPSGKYDGRISVYGHLSATYVNETDKRFVKKGQIIGRTGETGVSYGEHLHFELWENGKPINALQHVDVSK